MDAEKEKTLGLIAQERWCRDADSFGKRNKRTKTSYEEKESYKWEKNSHQLEKRFGVVARNRKRLGLHSAHKVGPN